jgi:hypothetical protein
MFIYLLESDKAQAKAERRLAAERAVAFTGLNARSAGLSEVAREMTWAALSFD